MGAVELRGHWLAAVFVIGACSFDASVAPPGDGPRDAPDVPPEAMPLLPTTCKAIKDADPAAATAIYDLDPDGPIGVGAPITTLCDMTTEGGGWTVIFLPVSSNLSSSNLAYTASTEELLNSATQVLLTYRDSTHAIVGQRAVFPMIQEWRVSSPFMYPTGELSVIASIDGASAMNATLKFGHKSFAGDLCTDAWDTAVAWGRICISGTDAPFFTGFATTLADKCAQSQERWDARGCGTDRKFTIAVR